MRVLTRFPDPEQWSDMLLDHVCKEICVETLTEIEMAHMAQRWLSASQIV